MTDRTDIDAQMQTLAAASEHLVRTVDRLCSDPDALVAPTALPGWARAHVVAHLALNAEGLARMVEGLHAGRPAAQYDSDDQRAADIDQLAGADGTHLRERLFTASTRLDDALGHLTAEQWEAAAERTPGGATIKVRAIPAMRRTEIEVHHADLDYGYGPEDWPRDFCALVLERFHTRAAHASRPFLAAPDDIIRTWEYGEPGDGAPRVSGQSWALAWWITGRGTGEGLKCSSGDLPRIGGW